MDWFDKVAPYLSDPLVLAGFAFFLFIGFARTLVVRGVIGPLKQTHSFTVLMRIITLGFVAALVIILLGFGLKYRELSSAEEKHALSLLRQELQSNLSAVNQVAQNIVVISKAASTVTEVLSDERFPVMAVLFPPVTTEVLEAGEAGATTADRALENLVASGLAANPVEVEKYKRLAGAIVRTIGTTRSTILSLGDSERKRYPVSNAVFMGQLDVLRRIRSVDTAMFEQAYEKALRLRNGYDILVTNAVGYLDAVAAVLDSESFPPERNAHASALSARWLYLAIQRTYERDVSESLSQFASVMAALDSVMSP